MKNGLAITGKHTGLDSKRDVMGKKDWNVLWVEEPSKGCQQYPLTKNQMALMDVDIGFLQVFVLGQALSL